MSIHLLDLLQCAFTVAFLLEASFKIWCLGLRGYFKRSLHCFEFVLVVATVIHIFPYFYRTHVTYFQACFTGMSDVATSMLMMVFLCLGPANCSSDQSFTNA